MAVLQWNDLSGQESGSPGDGEVGVGVGALPPHAGSQTPKRCLGVTGDCPTPGDPLPLPSVGLRILS